MELKWNSATVKVAADRVDPDAAAVVVDVQGERTYPSLDQAVATDAALVVTPDTVVERVGGLPSGETPDGSFFEMLSVRFDPLAWSGTYYDSCWGEGNWDVQLDGEQVPFFLTLFEPASVHPQPVRAGELVVLDNGGYSMSTGRIGLSVGIDAHGMIWASRWGMDTWFLGPRRGTDLLDEARRGLDALWSDGVLDLFGISSDLLSPDELRAVVDLLLDDSSYVLVTETTVTGPGIDTTLGELVPDRVRSIEATFGGDDDGNGTAP
ncbi:MAG: hypothetical protein ACKO04_09140 [Actinomycetes bacterium]